MGWYFLPSQEVFDRWVVAFAGPFVPLNDDHTDFVPVLTFECRGLEFVDVDLRVFSHLLQHIDRGAGGGGGG